MAIVDLNTSRDLKFVHARNHRAKLFGTATFIDSCSPGSPASERVVDLSWRGVGDAAPQKDLLRCQSIGDRGFVKLQYKSLGLRHADISGTIDDVPIDEGYQEFPPNGYLLDQAQGSLSICMGDACEIDPASCE